MTKDEILSIAEKHGCTRSAKHFKAMNDVFYLYEFSLSELAEFARACEKIGMEKAAKICDNQVQEYHCDGEPRRMEYVCAEEIRKAI